ncbi:hypothetical protein LGM57_33730 [Burkholderia cepacia]|uniref:hypothetical protein n=1 Tax=Burkholderia cepacia complex TaxID=87882 RepID=UPI00158C5C72|nr:MULTISPECIES: hypothetical protein [Burkholderia cepacia complex]MCA7981296.1 hypothetical protein [Burkholderia cepacia]
MKKNVDLAMAALNVSRGARMAGACALTALTLVACSQDYRTSAPEPVFNQLLTERLSKATLSPQVIRIDCYVDAGWFVDSLACDVAMNAEQSGKQASMFEVRSYFASSATSGSGWQFDADTLHDSKFRLVIEQPDPAVRRVRVHADQSRVSFEDAEYLAEKAVTAVDEYLRAHPTSDPQSLRDTWTNHGDRNRSDQGASTAAASGAANAGDRP